MYKNQYRAFSIMGPEQCTSCPTPRSDNKVNGMPKSPIVEEHFDYTENMISLKMGEEKKRMSDMA